ncbi:MAG: hypothetical protein WDW38_001029 [Sanguina aurantia]
MRIRERRGESAHRAGDEHFHSAATSADDSVNLPLENSKGKRQWAEAFTLDNFAGRSDSPGLSKQLQPYDPVGDHQRSMAQGWHRAQQQGEGNSQATQPESRYRKRVTIIQPISSSWESDAVAGRQRLQSSNSPDRTFPPAQQPASPLSWQSFSTVNNPSAEPLQYKPTMLRQPVVSFDGTPTPQQYNKPGFQSLRHVTQQSWSDILPPIPPLFSAGVAAAASVAAAAASLLALGDISLLQLPPALLAPYSPPSSLSMSAARSASDMASDFLKQNPHLLLQHSGTGSLNRPSSPNPMPAALNSTSLLYLYGSNSQADSPAGPLCPADSGDRSPLHTSHAAYPNTPPLPAHRAAAALPPARLTPSPNSSVGPAERDSSGGFRKQGSGSGSNGTSANSSGSAGGSGDGGGGSNGSSRESSGSLVQVHSQLSQLYEWYCSNKEVYMEQARRGLQESMDSGPMGRVTGVNNVTHGGFGQQADSARGATPVSAAAAQQTADVQRAIAKAVQIMQASSEVERQVRPEAGMAVGMRAGGPQAGRDATHTAVALALARVAAATGGLQAQMQAPLSVQA